MLVALELHLVANRRLGKHSPSFICTTAACNSKRMSYVWGWRLKLGGSSWWRSFLDNKCLTDLKHLNEKILEA